jgi:hypothetical protein
MIGALLTISDSVREYIRRSPIGVSEKDAQFLASQEEEFNELALSIARVQVTLNPLLKALCEKKEIDPLCLQHWMEIPAIPASAFKMSECSCLAANDFTTIFHSSGTTGQVVSRHGHNEETLALYESSMVPWFKHHLCGDDTKRLSFLSLTPSSLDAPHSSLAHMMATVINHCGAGEGRFTGAVDASKAWILDVQKTVNALEAMVEGNQPVVVLGTAFSFVHLVDHLRERHARFVLPAGSRVMETGGYKGRSRSMPKTELYQLISNWLGVPKTHIVCEYGMCELSSQAYDCRCCAASGVASHENERVFHFPPWARARIISPEDGREVGEGETGLIRVCDTANIGSSIMVQTEDLGIKRGRGFELLGRAVESEPRGCSLMS